MYMKKIGSCTHTSMIVPVWFSSTGRNSLEILAFIDQDICERIITDTEPIKLELATMTNRGLIVNCKRVVGLKIRGELS